MALDTAGNVKVDFIWGNLPMQPDDERTGSATQIGGSTGDYGWAQTTKVKSTTTNKALANHSVILNNWNGFPDYTPVAPFLDTIDQVAVPNVIGLTETAAGNALVAVGLVKGTVTTTADGATEENDGLVLSQSSNAGKILNLGTAINLVKYAYTAP